MYGHRSHRQRHCRGFTLVELMLSLAIFTLIAGISIPIYESFAAQNDLDIAATTVAQTIRRAEMLASASDGSSDWGVHVGTDGIVLFKGTSFAGRNTQYDETFDLPSDVTASGMTEIVTAEGTGYPLTTGTITLSGTAGRTYTITINEKGTVDY